MREKGEKGNWRWAGREARSRDSSGDGLEEMILKSQGYLESPHLVEVKGKTMETLVFNVMQTVGK